jgi:paraquat-inducible protein A
VLTVGLGGKSQSSTLLESVNIIWDEGQPFIALATAGTALLAPGLYILLRLYLLVPIALLGRTPPGFGGCVRALRQVTRWSMVEVLTVGGLLSLVRLAALADATPGPAMVALGVLTVLFAAIESAGLRHLWWAFD